MNSTMTQKYKGGWIDSRSDFYLSTSEKGGKSTNFHIAGVRTYGILIGWVLYKIGFASYTSTKTYVNTSSFFKHLAESALKTTAKSKNGDLNSKKITDNILNDKALNKSKLTPDGIAQIFKDCLSGKYGTIKEVEQQKSVKGTPKKVSKLSRQTQVEQQKSVKGIPKKVSMLSKQAQINFKLFKLLHENSKVIINEYRNKGSSLGEDFCMQILKKNNFDSLFIFENKEDRQTEVMSKKDMETLIFNLDQCYKLFLEALDLIEKNNVNDFNDKAVSSACFPGRIQAIREWIDIQKKPTDKEGQDIDFVVMYDPHDASWIQLKWQFVEKYHAFVKQNKLQYDKESCKKWIFEYAPKGYIEIKTGDEKAVVTEQLISDTVDELWDGDVYANLRGEFQDSDD